MPLNRRFVVVRDGYSDYLVLKKFIQVISKKHYDYDVPDANFYEMESINIYDPLSKYLDKVSKNEDYSLSSDAAKEFIKQLLPIYFASLKKLQRELVDTSNKEVIIINADSERLLLKRDNFFEEWAFSVKVIIQYSIELFYEKLIGQGYSYNDIPFYLPLILFPSSEILVAACIFDFSKENIRELKPTPALKKKVYGSESIPEVIKNGKLDEVLIQNVTNEKINDIYRELPEIRPLIHSLTL